MANRGHPRKMVVRAGSVGSGEATVLSDSVVKAERETQGWELVIRSSSTRNQSAGR